MDDLRALLGIVMFLMIVVCFGVDRLGKILKELKLANKLTRGNQLGAEVDAINANARRRREMTGQ